MMGLRMIGFVRDNGTHWCFRNEDGIHYDPVCHVRNNGTVVWKMNKEVLTEDELFRIANNSRKEKAKIRRWEERLAALKQELQALPKKTTDYYRRIHSLHWHMEALRVANIE